jgi:hypothetical protein
MTVPIYSVTGNFQPFATAYPSNGWGFGPVSTFHHVPDSGWAASQALDLSLPPPAPPSSQPIAPLPITDEPLDLSLRDRAPGSTAQATTSNPAPAANRLPVYKIPASRGE